MVVGNGYMTSPCIYSRTRFLKALIYHMCVAVVSYLQSDGDNTFYSTYFYGK